MLMSWSSGARALLDVSLLSSLPGKGTVIGSHGWAELSPGFHAPTRLIVEIRGADRYERTIEDRTAGRFPFDKHNAGTDIRWQIFKPLVLTTGMGWERWDRDDQAR